MNNSKYATYVFLLLLYVSFFLSGSCALIYQIVWTRQSMLLLGSTAYAVSTVLSIFFLGLGLGSFWGGKIAERTSNPMRWYAWVELFIGLWALIIVDFVSNKGQIVFLLIRLFPENTWLLFFIRILISMFWFALPSLCMGMTFPLLVRYEQNIKGKSSRYISLLYSINTIGAVLGAFGAGFLFVPKIGYGMTFYIAIGISICVSLIAGFLSLFRDALVNTGKKSEAEPVEIEENEEGSELKKRVIFLGVFISGFVCLALEVLWTRLLIMIFFRNKLRIHFCIDFSPCGN